MNRTINRFANRPIIAWSVCIACIIAAAATYSIWWPTVDRWIDNTISGQRNSQSHDSASDDGHDDHASHDDHSGHDHGHESTGHGHSENESIKLSKQAIKNLGLTKQYLQPIKLSNYYRSVTVPGIVVPKPGRTAIQVSSPMIGIVTHVHAVSGEAVNPGDLLFEIRLTYEDLVETQTQLLKNLADLEVEQREMERLSEVTRSGAVASKVLLDRQYAKQKIESAIAAQRAALRLHGLTDEQIDTIVNQKRLLRELTIVAPSIDQHEHDAEPLRLSKLQVQPASLSTRMLTSSTAECNLTPTSAVARHELPLVIEQLKVSKGQGVAAGEMLCALSDYSTLYLEGKAFEQDAPAITEVASKGWPLQAIIPTLDGQEVIQDLKLAYVANEVDPDSRALSFFVDLPNKIVRDQTNEEDQRFVTWKYRVGQRMQVRVPIEAWENQIVLPVDAAVKEGADWFVFVQNGDHFDRVPVHVKYRDQQNVVIENDGAIFPGDVVALRSAHQLQMAIKNRSGGAVDPHAGHNH